MDSSLSTKRKKTALQKGQNQREQNHSKKSSESRLVVIVINALAGELGESRKRKTRCALSRKGEAVEEKEEEGFVRNSINVDKNCFLDLPGRSFLVRVWNILSFPSILSSHRLEKKRGGMR